MSVAFIRPNIVNHVPTTGDLRFNESTQCTELFTGTDWVTVVGDFHGVDYESRINALAEKHPGIADLKKKLDVMVRLAEKNNGTN